MSVTLHDAVIVDIDGDRDLSIDFLQHMIDKRIPGLGGSSGNGLRGSYWGPYAAEHRPVIEAFFEGRA